MDKEKDKIYKIVKELINNRDFKEITLKEIIEMYGWSNSKFYNRYLNKDEILKEIFEEIKDNLKKENPELFPYLTLKNTILEIYNYFIDGNKKLIKKNLNDYKDFFTFEFKKLLLVALKRTDFFETIDNQELFINLLINNLIYAIENNYIESLELLFL